jgi:hypothetical protein
VEGRLLFKDCCVLGPLGEVRHEQAVVIRETCIFEVAPSAEVPALPGDWVIESKGRLLAPSLSDCAPGFSVDYAQRALEVANRIREGVTFFVCGETPAQSTLGTRLASWPQLATCGTQDLEFSALPPAGRSLNALEFSSLLMGTQGRGCVLESAMVLHREALRLAELSSAFDSEGAMFRVAYFNPGALKTRVFGHGSGSIGPDCLADLVLYDFLPPLHRRITLLELLRARVAWVVSDGNVLLREGELLGASFLELAKAAQQSMNQALYV